MTVSKGSSWGATVARPPDLRIAANDAELAAFLSDGSGVATAVAAGDMWRTVGGGSVEGRDELNELSLDLLEVRLDDRLLHAVSHVVARRPWWRGAWLCGAVYVAMNAEFIGDYDVAPRGHPNDGRVETLSADATMPMRQRIAVRARLRNASHLPHPQISTRSTHQVEFAVTDPLRVAVDGRDCGLVRSLAVRVLPDAAVLYA